MGHCIDSTTMLAIIEDDSQRLGRFSPGETTSNVSPPLHDHSAVGKQPHIVQPQGISKLVYTFQLGITPLAPGAPQHREKLDNLVPAPLGDATTHGLAKGGIPPLNHVIRPLRVGQLYAVKVAHSSAASSADTRVRTSTGPAATTYSPVR
ncbi:hypothetical protein CfB38_7016 (plasmid) [Citrobacter freundii]|nr:hypothetical protein CfB38_7016 [Citrobacter freundii]